MNVLFLSTNTELAAYVRYRALQFFPVLEAAGIRCHHHGLFDRRMDEIFYAPGRTIEKMVRLLRGTLRRAGQIARVRRLDVVVVLREAHLIGPPILEHAICKLGIPLVLDIDDAIWQPYLSPTYGRMAKILKCAWKVDAVLGMAKAVTAGNQYVATYAKDRNSNVTLLPTVVDTNIYRPTTQRHGDPVVLGWIGSHSSFQYVLPLLPMLGQLYREVPFELRLVGSCTELPAQPFPVDNLAWRPEREVADVQSFDIGLFPLLDDPWSRGKSAFKAVQYGAVGIPTVASPVTTNCDVVQDGVTGFLPENEEQWFERLRALILDATLRRCMGQAARERIAREYSLAAHGPRLLDVIRNAARR